MKKAIDKLLNVDKKILIFLSIICIIGIITGSLFMTVLSENDRLSIFESLETFISEYGSLNSKIELTNNLIINLLYIFSIWLLGISIIGLPIVIIIIFLKSFLLSFTITSFIIKYKTKGILLSMIYLMPHQIINLITIMYLGVYSIKLSSYIIEAIIYKKNLNFKNITNRYILVFIVSIIIIILTSLYETFIMPIILQKVINISL